MKEQGADLPSKTTIEVFRMLPEGTLAEIVDAALYVSPAPTPKHQKLLGKIYRSLSGHVEKHKAGEVILAPCDVFLDEHSNAVQPDIIFISAGNSSIIREDAIHGIPDLLIEILSPGNSNHDLVRKKDLY